MKHLHRWVYRAAVLAAFFIVCTPSYAQWQTPDHAVPVGRGAGTGFKSVGPCNANIAIVGQGASADPACGSVSLSAGATGTLAVGNGGTGQTSFTANAPLIGNGSSAVALGSRSGNTTVFGTTTGTLTSGNCVQFDASGNLIAAGTACNSPSIQVNAQTGTSYSFVNGDGTKLVTGVNAAAQAYALPQAGSGGNFAAGWYVDIKNVGTTLAGVITITPTTSTINGQTTLALSPGQWVRIVSDGTNYQLASRTQQSAFYVSKGNVAQTGMLNNSYDRITWSTTKYSVGGNFSLSGNRITVLKSGIVNFNVAIWWTANAASSGTPTFLIKIIKNSGGTCNGSDVFAGVGTALVGAPGLAAAQANGSDFAIAGDVYETCAYATSSTSANNLQIDGNPAHVFWSGFAAN